MSALVCHARAQCNHNTQSFLECIAQYYNRLRIIEDTPNEEILPEVVQSNENTISINKLKEIIVDHLNLDNFISYNGGALVSQFYSADYGKELHMGKLGEEGENNPKVTTSDVYLKFGSGGDSERRTQTILQKVYSAYKRFIEYLTKDEEVAY